jgi:hypothetical protein
MKPEKYLGTYTANNSDSFWICGVKDCKINFPHEVGYTPDRAWKHVYADDYLNDSSLKKSG